MTSSKNLPDALVQEVRATIGLQCRYKLMTGKKASGEKQNAQERLIEKMFHCSEGFDSHLLLFFRGKGVYEMAFVPHQLENNREGNELRKDGKMYELRSVLHCDIASRYVLHESGFTVDATAKSGPNNVSGRVLNEKTLLVIATLKIAHKQYYDYCIECTGDNPSGEKLEDMLLCVRQKCFIEFKGKKNAKLARTAKPLRADQEMTKQLLVCRLLRFCLVRSYASKRQTNGNSRPQVSNRKEKACICQEGRATDQEQGATGRSRRLCS